MRKLILVLTVATLGFFPLCLTASKSEGPIYWQDWSDQLFEQAKRENKFVILDLEAVWCHWCHVMAGTTYQDSTVVELINSKYIPVRVDQDAHPDLSVRYEEWGWPATIVFSPDGSEIVKRRGYIPPQVMVSLLKAIIEDPSQGPSVLPELDTKPSEQAFLTDEQKGVLLVEHRSLYDNEFGGWGMRFKLIDSNNLEYAMVKAQEGDKLEEEMARQTLDQALNLIDREWGGFYQYSDERNWKSPHYEKIMPIQAQYMRLYIWAYAIWNEPRYLEAAKRIENYVSAFWTSPEGVFYTSQDADVDGELTGHIFYALNGSERRRLGRIPKIDTHIYSRENGWMIASLASLYDVTGEQKYIEEAVRAARWILQNRNLLRGGFRHDVQDRAGPYLGDTLSMGQAFLSLYVSTADRKWLKSAEAAMRFIQKFFRDNQGGGFIASSTPKGATGVFRKPIKQIEENVAIVRFGNSLFHYTGKTEYKHMAEYAMRYLLSPAIIKNKRFLTGLLLADRELAQDPVHIAVVGLKSDENAKALYWAGLRSPMNYKRIEWWDKREGLLPNMDVTYPDLDKAAAFVCVNKTCSLPFFSPEKITQALDRSQQNRRQTANLV